MKNKFFRLIACLLAAAMLLSITVLPVIAEDNVESAQTEDTDVPADEVGEDSVDENAEEPADSDDEAEEPAETDKDAEDEEEEVDASYLTDEEVITRCTKAAENDSFILYLDSVEERVGLYVKESGFVHWSNPINAMLDKATSKPATKKNRLSNIGIKYGDVANLFPASAFVFSYRDSTENDTTTVETLSNGVKFTYNYKGTTKKNPIHYTIPVYFLLEDDGMVVRIPADEIIECIGYRADADEEDSKTEIRVLTEIAMTPYMGAAADDETGYMFIPDGSGAIVELNNGKTNYKNYSEYIYGRDITNVRETAPNAVEQVTLPVMAMVRGSNALVMIATKGETFATVNAAVAGNKNDQCGYNYCYFSFTVRSNDNYQMAGDSSSIIVFEKGDGKIPVEAFEVKYIPVTSDEEVVPYTDIADVYRNYLINEKGLTKKTAANSAPLVVDYFGGTLKSKSILGIPIDIKTAYTTFEQAIEITTKLQDMGVDQIVVNYNDWTNDAMSDKIDTADSVASCLGGKSDFKEMLKYFADNNIDFYGTVDGFTFKSAGNGFITLFDTAYRVSRSYARPYAYNLAYDTPKPGVASALLAPKSIEKLTNKVSKNVGKLDLPGVGLGDWANSLWSDFSNKNHTNRATTASYIVDYYKAVTEKTTAGKVIADDPNAYLIPYVDVIKNLPLQSSQFKIADYDIPFTQMVLHGYIPYSCEAINSSANSKELFLRAIAAGSNIQYDFIYNEATKLVNTDYVGLYYATYEGWLTQCAAEYELANEILAPVSDAVITGYVIDGEVITTTYSNGVVTKVNLENGKITANGKTYNYSDYVDEGGLR